MSQISEFKIECPYGHTEITVSGNGKQTTHKYWSVPKEAVLNLVNSKSAPSVSDFEEWIRKDKERQGKINPTPQDWWTD